MDPPVHMRPSAAPVAERQRAVYDRGNRGELPSWVAEGPQLNPDRFGHLAPGPILLALKPAQIEGRHSSLSGRVAASDASRPTCPDATFASRPPRL